MRDALTKLLDGYDARRRGELEREQRAKDEAARFLGEFAELRRRVIRPVFEAAGALLEARGYQYSISEQEFVAGGAGGTGASTEAGIAMRILPPGKAPRQADERPLSITTRHYNRTVWINSGESPNSGGLAGAMGALPLEKLTKQRIEEELIGFVARVVAS